MSARPIARLASVLVSSASLALTLGGCGQKSYPDVADANNIGGYVQAGRITYQLQISRELNAYSAEDSGYLAGVRAPPPGRDEEWYGVFLWAKNQTHRPAATADSFDIVDTQGSRYYPIPINPQLNPYAWTAQTLEPLATVPTPGSAAYFGPTGGKLVLFKINVSAYANRPLTFEIRAPGETRVSAISIDL